MNKTLSILKNQMRMMLRQRLWLFFNIAAPLMFVFILGLAQGGNSNGAYDARINVAIVRLDGGRGELADQIVAQVQQSAVIQPALYADNRAYTTDEAATRNDVQQRFVSAALVLPADMDAEVRVGNPVTISFLSAPGATTHVAVEQEINAILTRVSAAYDVGHTAATQAAALRPFVSASEREQYARDAIAMATIQLTHPVISVFFHKTSAQAQPHSDQQITSGFNQSGAGSLVQWLMTGAFSTSAAIVGERRRGTLRRMMVMPVTRGQVLWGNLLVALTVALLQALIIVIFGALLGAQWGHDLPALSASVLCYTLAMGGLAMLFASVARSDGQAIGLGILIANIAAPLAGAWFPRELLPTFMVDLGKLFPSGWAMQAFSGVISHGYHMIDVLGPCAVMLGFAAVFMGIGIARFKFE
jgi:ABC-2 type transport system permease protein